MRKSLDPAIGFRREWTHPDIHLIPTFICVGRYIGLIAVGDAFCRGEGRAMFLLDGRVRERDDKQFGIEVDATDSSARFTRFGGQLLEWQTRADAPVLWLSDAAVFDDIAPIRGGVPVCWPWFGDDAGRPGWPKHGFARTRKWQLDKADDEGDEIVLRFSLPRQEQEAEYWPHATRPTLLCRVGACLTIELITTNVDRQPITFTEALHAYFRVHDIETSTIAGLEDTAYFDQLTQIDCPAQGRPLQVREETDRIYRNLSRPIALYDAGFQRTIMIEHEGARDAIVWNPWIEKSARLGDMGPGDAYRRMMCIETGTVGAQPVVLQPGQTHTLRMKISVDDLSADD